MRPESRLKLVHVVPHIDQEAAGPSYSVPRLCQSLSEAGDDVQLSCLAARGPVPGVALQVYKQWPILGGFAVSTDLAQAMRRMASEVDIIHNNSLWSMVNVAAGWVVPGRRAKLVTSPRGTLSAWALNRSSKKKAVLWPLQRRALTHAAMLHATSEVEYGEIRAQGFQAPALIVPNGIDLPEISLSYSTAQQRTLLYLSRIHPIKGIDRLLEAWAQVQDNHPSWRLVIAGKGDEQHVKEVTDLAASLQAERVEFPGPLYGEAKTQAYLDADLMVLPTHSENFGMVVAEALALGRPALVSKGAPWSVLQTERCGWWVDNDVPSLVEALRNVLSLERPELAEMGMRGRLLMEREFGWESVATRMRAGYQWLLNGGQPPACVRLD